MNPFYTHNHLSSMSHHQFSSSSSSSSTTTPPPSLSNLPSHLVQHHQQAQHLQSSPTQQFLQPQSQSPAAVVAAAASFYASRNNPDSFNRRHIPNINSSMQNSPSSSASNTPTNLFGGIEDSLFARAEALADIGKAAVSHHMVTKQDNLYIATAAANHQSTLTNHHLHSMAAARHSFDNNANNNNNNNNSQNIDVEQQQQQRQLNHYHHHHNHNQTNGINNGPLSETNSFYNAFYSHHHHHHAPLSPSSQHQINQHAAIAAAAAIHHTEIDIDPRELELFAERFKQRRIKLGVTQADVGQQLSKLKLPGVGSLSQSTICRFESLTLSHNNMIALKPVLQSWLEQAEADARNKRKNDEAMSTSSITNSSTTSTTSLNSNCINNMNCNNSNISSGSSSNSCMDRKRKRTSIAAPEKRSLEAFFAVQPRPSGEKIAQIADKLDLKKNVVRVWFCNQRQKQKRMKFAAIQGR